MTPKHTLKIYQQDSRIIAAQIRNPDKLVINPVAKWLLTGIVAAALTAYGAFSAGMDILAWIAVALSSFQVAGLVLWASVNWYDDDSYFIERAKHVKDRKVDKPFLTLPRKYYEYSDIRDLRNVFHRVNTFLQHESTAPRVEQIIEAGIQAHELVTDRSSRVDLSAKLIEKLAALEVQLKEEQDMKRETAEDHIDLLLGKD